MISDYTLRVYGTTLNRKLGFIPMIDAFNMQYSMILNSVGSFAVTVDDTPANRALYQKDNIIDVLRRRTDTGLFVNEASYFVRMIQRVSVGESDRLVIGGLSLEHLLQRRIVDPDDDSIAPESGFSTKAGDAGDVIRAYVREQCADLCPSVERQFVRFTVPAPNETGKGVGANLRYSNLLEEIRRLADVGNVDFRITHNGEGDLTMIIGDIGDDQRIPLSGETPYLVLSPQRGNLNEIKFTMDAKSEITTVYVLGDGEGAARTVIEVPSGAVNNTIYNRIESRIEGDQGSNNYQLYLEGLKTLVDNEVEETLEFVPDTSRTGARYRIDWNFGDKITVKWDELQKDFQFNTVEIQIQNGDEQISSTVKELTNE